MIFFSFIACREPRLIYKLYYNSQLLSGIILCVVFFLKKYNYKNQAENP